MFGKTLLLNYPIVTIQQHATFKLVAQTFLEIQIVKERNNMLVTEKIED